MAVFRCKICGGDLVVQEGLSSCVCEYCGSRQTLPAVRDENLTALFNRANVLRMKCEFDKAAEIYEKIIQGNPEESEAYWGLILCKYGIEYVEDPESRERIPTCHRASYDAVTADDDYRSAIRYADAERRQLYAAEAVRIDEIQRGIIALAQKESPYDVFICYKESDGGSRTQDSVIANDIYYQLTAQNLKVFYAAVTLEDKLGSEYEPVIFSALNSAKVMLVLGTKPEYFNAVWVKNEWSRFLKLMKKDRTRMLIPCYRDMDPYELPEEFAHLQAQDMGKIGFITDLIRGIRKVMTPETPAAVPVTAASFTAVPAAAEFVPNYNALLKRGFMALEDNKWEDADDFFEQVLNQNAECGEAYWGKFLVAKKSSDWKSLSKELANKVCDQKDVSQETLEAFPADSAHVEAMIEKYAISEYYDAQDIRSSYEFKRTYPSGVSCLKERKQKILHGLEADRTFMRAKKYAGESLREQVSQFQNNLEKNIDEIIAQEQRSDTEKISVLRQNYLSFLKQTDEDVVQHFQKVSADRENRYQQGLLKMKEKNYSDARYAFLCLKPYKDSAQLAEQCERLDSEAAKKKARTKTITLCICTILAAVAIAIKTFFIPLYEYNQASELMASRHYEEALAAFTELGNFRDSTIKLKECWRKLHPNLQIGDHVFYGHYEQDNNLSNGAEAIEWRVLAQEDNRLLIISEYGLDAKQYNEKYGSTTWENCTLRSWLNEEFYKSAFSAGEQTLIAETEVIAADNLKYRANVGNNTMDRIFLLSIDEVSTYFKNNEDRQCKVTDYAKSNDAYRWWWLRSPGYGSDSAALVSPDGSVDFNGSSALTNGASVRPVLWLNL